MSDIAQISVATARIPQTYANAKTALYNCVSVDECQSWADKAAALASYAKQAKDEELMRMATRIRDRAIRRAGELLKQIEPKRGANQNIGAAADTKVLTRTDAAEQAGMSKRQAVTAIRVANVPAEQFEKLVESSTPPTVTKLAEMGTTPAPKPIIDLHGRDPGEFNRSLHFVGDVEEYARQAAEFDLERLLPGLIPAEAERLRAAIQKIDGVHDQIITRI
ncbi:hypothetical protein [Paradevosia shaoguanensis]|uniref:Uncharacterized protein n=1 Tax=Paradevosia shaoguanensis TaxID=1335043 RepID=A0AA41UID5_9HYPH|nr:hypothetical protein [Paradevosia shaoguanensis]MCF1744753.1 hypothetical protein [Paradevosia shaoguanensis]MCI0129236.1 hypothetical protein [Paradevosia shaoguanensis]